MNRDWTDADLEAYLDGEMPNCEAEAMAACLRTDPELRARCTAASRADELARESLVRHVSRSPPATMRSRVRWLRVGVGAAAGVAACAAIVVVLRTPPAERPGVRASVTPGVTGVSRPTAPSGQHLVRVVLSVPLAGAGPQASSAPSAELTSPEEHKEVGAATDRHAGAGGGNAEMRRLGETLRSATSARRALDELPREAQLTACEEWARAPHLRTVAFTRLRELGRDGHEEDVRRVVGRLAENPVLRGWVASYAPSSRGQPGPTRSFPRGARPRRDQGDL